MLRKDMGFRLKAHIFFLSFFALRWYTEQNELWRRKACTSAFC